MKKILKFMLKAIPILIILMVVMVSVKMINDRGIDYDVALGGTEIPTFNEEIIDFENTLDDSTSLPFTAGAVIDVDNDGVEELFIGGGPGQNDAIMAYRGGEFVNITKSAKYIKPPLNDATFAASVIDVDNNGYADLIVSRTNGIWLYKNSSGQFSSTQLDIPLNDKTSPMSVAIADINRDGHFDMYVAGYIKKELVEGQNIFNKEGYGGTSLMLLNNGDNTFTDITRSSGLYYVHNTFMGVFADLDNDGLEDLTVAHDTGHVKTWKNLGNNQFKDMPNPNSQVYSYPMGIAVSDLGNDGDLDMFFSNVGSTPPRFMVKGDLRDDQTPNFDWILFENKGGFDFEDVADKYKLADYEFSWGAVFEDFNLDGRDDLVVSENYIGLPPHKIPFLRLPGRFLVQTAGGEFAAVGAEAGIENKQYSIAPVTADFNQDGYPDLVHINLAGKSKAFISRGGDANYLKVKLPNNIGSIAANVSVQRTDGTTVNQTFLSGEGLCSDQSHTLIFGLGQSQAAEVTVQYINGMSDSMNGPFQNETLVFQTPVIEELKSTDEPENESVFKDDQAVSG